MKNILTLALFALPVAVAAQGPNCAPYDAVMSHLQGKYDEAQIAAGLTGGNLLEFLANGETGSWSIVVTTPEGIACLVASGSNVQISPLPPRGEDS